MMTRPAEEIEEEWDTTCQEIIILEQNSFIKRYNELRQKQTDLVREFVHGTKV